jgi:hypothetical protein
MDTVITHARNADVDFENAGFVGIESRSVPRMLSLEMLSRGTQAVLPDDCILARIQQRTFRRFPIGSGVGYT